MALRTFLTSYQGTLMDYKDKMKKHVDQFYEDTIAASPEMRKHAENESKNKASNPNTTPLSTLNTCLLQTKSTLDAFLRIQEDQTTQIQHNILDNLRVYEDHYSSFNHEMITKAQEMWDLMHTERTNMLWSKEEYINSMHSYKQIAKMIQTF